jgi:tetraprenyl-beta-curcumene synthase
MSRVIAVDQARLTPALIGALLSAAVRELTWGLREVAGELAAWRRRAEAIPEEAIREDALYALAHKRTNTDGAALFATLLDGRNRDLLLLLANYQAIWDLLDALGERHPTEANGRELHLALMDALDPARPLADYYRHHPWRDDGGYLAALVERCRQRCGEMPSYEQVRDLVVEEARLAQVQALNHLPDRGERDSALRRWALAEFPEERRIEWYEITAAASASLVIHPLLALAAKSNLTEREIAMTRNTYWPWVSLATTMLDNFVDQAEDRAEGNHNYFTHYSDSQNGLDRLCRFVRRVTSEAMRLPNGHRHAVVVCSMIAMYLSKDCDETAHSRVARRRLRGAGGDLVKLLVPILRAWRVAYSQRSD